MEKIKKFSCPLCKEMFYAYDDDALYRDFNNNSDIHTKCGYTVWISSYSKKNGLEVEVFNHDPNYRCIRIEYDFNGIPKSDEYGEDYHLIAHFYRHFNDSMGFKEMYDEDGELLYNYNRVDNMRELCLNDGTPVEYLGYDEESRLYKCQIEGRAIETEFNYYGDIIKGAIFPEEKICFKIKDDEDPNYKYYFEKRQEEKRQHNLEEIREANRLQSMREEAIQRQIDDEDRAYYAPHCFMDLGRFL